MEISSDTLLTDAPGFEALSVRAKNVCRSGRIRTIGQLSKLTDVDLMRLPNCGHKTIIELRSLYLPTTASSDSNGIVKSTDKTLTEACNNAMTLCSHADNSLLKDFVMSFGSEATFVRLAITEPNWIIGRLGDEAYVRNVALRHDLGELLSVLATQPFLIFNESEALKALAVDLASRMADFAMADTYYALPEAVRNCIGTFYRSHFAALSVRSQNAIRYFGQLHDIVPTLFGYGHYDPRVNRNCGRKSAQEISTFMAGVKSMLVRLLGSISSGTEDDVIRILAVRYTQIYTFLTFDEAMRLASFVLHTDRKPSMFIISRFIATSDRKDTRVFDELYGISVPFEPRNMADISDELGLSRERVRQLGLGQLSLPSDLEPMRADVLACVESRVISSEDPMWRRVAEENMLDMPPRAIMGLVRSMGRDLEVVRIAGSDRAYLVARPMLSGVSIPQCVAEVNKLVRMRRSEPGTVNVAQILRRCRTAGELHPAVDELAAIIVDHFAGRDNVTVVGPATLYLSANFVDRRAAIVDILERHGRPMTIEEMFDAFNKMYPDHPMRSITSMRAFIFQCDRVLAVGKSGQYVLDSWTDRFHGTILQYVTSLVEQSAKPMSIEEIADRARAVFPRTTPNSIATIISIDPEKRLARFAHGYFGVAHRSYPGWEDRLRDPMQRLPFAERFEQFKEFVRRNESLPSSSSDPEGITLRRWLSNVLAGRISVTDDDIDDLRHFLDDHRHLPQNADEYRFRRRCRDFLDHTNTHGALPTINSDRRLYQWYHLSLKARPDWTDNRAAYFDELIAALRAKNLV